MAGRSSKTGIAYLLKQVESAGIPFDEDYLRSAFMTAQEIYDDQMHWTGVPLIEHALGALGVLLQFKPDDDAVVACLLHHALQTKNCTVADLEDQFGPQVRSLVGGVHLLSHVTLQGRRLSIDDLRLMLLTVSDDIRTVLIILCDRCHLLKRIDQLSAEEQKRVCDDVLHLFAPVAARLGIYALKHDLEARAFSVLYPLDAERLEEQLKQVEAERGGFLDATADALRAFLAEQGIEAVVEAREKQLYSIFNKMRSKSISHIDDLYDLFAVRVIVDTEEECYRSLGLLHRIGRPVANRFKDYIAFSKPNGYQSLHTTLVQLPGAPENTFVEVQVRTHDMHREAEYGVAAHWGYKESGSTARAVHTVQLHKMLAFQQSVGEEEESGTTLADHIFVLTPKGDVVELPEGATPLDFAFQVHTDVGLSFRSARVNGAIVPLDHELENADVVEIQKYRTPHPSPRWLQLLKMATSRTKLKRYLYAKDRPHLIAKGRELLNKELRRFGLSPLDTELSLLRLYDGGQLSFQKREDLLVKIGQESERPSAILVHLDALKEHDFSKKQERKHKRQQRKDTLIEVEGGVPMPTRFAKCCKPNEGERVKICGVINRSGEVMIHRYRCGMLRHTNPERRVKVWWR